MSIYWSDLQIMSRMRELLYKLDLSDKNTMSTYDTADILDAILKTNRT